jgi:DNA excision repair protein ERCC-4
VVYPRVNNGSQANRSDIFANLSAEWWSTVGVLIERRLIRIPNEEKLIAQLTRRRKLYDSRGREKVESKADLASRGVESPDRADALIGAVMMGPGSDPYVLTTGDYSVAGLQDVFSIERKTVSDLVGCCMGENRERFERELHRLRGYRFKRLLVIGSEAEILAGQYHSNIKPKAVLATVWAFEVRYECPVLFSPTPQAAARQIERWVFYYSREVVETVNNLWRAGAI